MKDFINVHESQRSYIIYRFFKIIMLRIMMIMLMKRSVKTSFAIIIQIILAMAYETILSILTITSPSSVTHGTIFPILAAASSPSIAHETILSILTTTSFSLHYPHSLHVTRETL